MKIGFTGTRKGLTTEQYSMVKWLFEQFKPTEFHHGDCIGCDEQAAMLAREATIHIVKHPPVNQHQQANSKADETRKRRAYLKRNHNIVDETDIMIATPGEAKEIIRSGTWATIRYARNQNKRIIIIFPNGDTHQ
jgi:hypothetical protein